MLRNPFVKERKSFRKSHSKPFNMVPAYFNMVRPPNSYLDFLTHLKVFSFAMSLLSLKMTKIHIL